MTSSTIQNPADELRQHASSFTRFESSTAKMQVRIADLQKSICIPMHHTIFNSVDGFSRPFIKENEENNPMAQLSLTLWRCFELGLLWANVPCLGTPCDISSSAGGNPKQIAQTIYNQYEDVNNQPEAIDPNGKKTKKQHLYIQKTPSRILPKNVLKILREI